MQIENISSVVGGFTAFAAAFFFFLGDGFCFKYVAIGGPYECFGTMLPVLHPVIFIYGHTNQLSLPVFYFFCSHFATGLPSACFFACCIGMNADEKIALCFIG